MSFLNIPSVVLLTGIFAAIYYYRKTKDSNKSENLTNPSETITAKSGQVSLELIIPGNQYSTILLAPKRSRITITGAEIITPIIVEREMPASRRQTLVIPQIPVGAKTAEIQVIDNNGAVISSRTQNFYMTSKDKMNLGSFIMGIKINNTGSCAPSNVEVPFNTTLFWENWDYNNDRTISMNGGAVSVGPIPKAVQASSSGGFDTFSSSSHTFDVPNTGEGGWTVMHETPNDVPPLDTLHQIKAFSDNDIIAIGFTSFEDYTISPCVLRYDGQTWNRELVSTGIDGDYLISIAADSPNNIFVGSANGVILHYDGSSWVKSYDANYYNQWISGIWITSSGEVYATQDQYILLYDGSTWSVKYYNEHGSSHGIWGCGNDIYVIGVGYLPGENWQVFHNFTTIMDIPDTANFPSRIWGTSPSDIFVADASSQLYHYDGTNWSRMDIPHPELVDIIYSIAGNSPTDVYAVTAIGMMHYDGFQWTEMLNIPGNQFNQAFMCCCTSQSETLYAAGLNIIAKYVPGGTTPKTEETYVYDEGFGAPGSIFCFTPPVLTSILDGNNDNRDNVIAASTVSFNLDGMNFGDSQNSVNGKVRFIDTSKYIFYEAIINSWAENSITGSVTIPQGTYRVEVTARGCPSTDAVLYYKGQNLGLQS